MKKFFFIFLALLLIPVWSLGDEAAGMPTYAPPEQSETRIRAEDVPVSIQNLLSVATGEIGYTEGSNNYSKYGEWSGDANAAWCAEFICWCVWQTDENYGTELFQKVYPKWGGQNTGKNWFITEGRFVFRKGYCPGWGYQWMKGTDHYLKKNEYIPCPGDVVFFSYNQAGDTQHVALTEYCTMDASGNVRIHVIEGNNPDSVQRNVYKLDNSQILGFGLPVDRVDTVCRFGNSGAKVTELQNLLCELGYLDEKDITGTYGSHTKQAVIAFQKNESDSLSANGIADRITLQRIQECAAEQEDSAPETWLVEE